MSVVSFARGCRLVDALGRRGRRGDDRKGDAGNIELFGSRANDLACEVALRLASVIELTSDWGPKENDEPMECRGRELDGEGRFGTAGIAKLE